jgi:hypothetical protein
LASPEEALGVFAFACLERIPGGVCTAIGSVEWLEEATAALSESGTDKFNTGTCLTFILGLGCISAALLPDPESIGC